jgi:coenzyme F420-reducing hydrogenase gamma subunit
MVAEGTPCLGPVTQDGCGALCPSYRRGCFGCFGPMETPNMASHQAWLAKLGTPAGQRVQLYRSFNAYAAAFREASEREASESDG